MKKAFITTALFAAAAITPCFTSVLGAIDIPGRASDLARAAASPMFWHIYDEVLTRSLARITTSVAPPAEQRPSQTDSVVCVLVQVVLTRAFDVSRTETQNFDAVSIPRDLIRRVIERRSTAAPKSRAVMHHS